MGPLAKPYTKPSDKIEVTLRNKQSSIQKITDLKYTQNKVELPKARKERYVVARGPMAGLTPLLISVIWS
jgi:hypothetical protein